MRQKAIHPMEPAGGGMSGGAGGGGTDRSDLWIAVAIGAAAIAAVALTWLLA